MASGWDIVACPETGCDQIAESSPLYWTMNKTGGGYTVHLRIRCMDGHITFTEQSSTGSG